MSIKAAGFIVYRMKESFEYLLLQASVKHHYWSPPKGHVEENETLMEAAYRETEEEAGLYKHQLKVTDFHKVIKYFVDGRNKEVTYWLAELVSKTATITISNEHQDYKWATLHEAVKLVERENLKILLRDCNSYLLKTKSNNNYNNDDYNNNNNNKKQ